MQNNQSIKDNNYVYQIKNNPLSSYIDIKNSKVLDIIKIKLYNKIAFDLEVYYIMKRTYQPNNRKKAKKHGFFSRIKGNVLKSRRAKKRKKLCA